jgi:hypothetical protein
LVEVCAVMLPVEPEVAIRSVGAVRRVVASGTLFFFFEKKKGVNVRKLLCMGAYSFVGYDGPAGLWAVRGVRVRVLWVEALGAPWQLSDLLEPAARTILLQTCRLNTHKSAQVRVGVKKRE